MEIVHTTCHPPDHLDQVEVVEVEVEVAPPLPRKFCSDLSGFCCQMPNGSLETISERLCTQHTAISPILSRRIPFESICSLQIPIGPPLSPLASALPALEFVASVSTFKFSGWFCRRQKYPEVGCDPETLTGLRVWLPASSLPRCKHPGLFRWRHSTLVKSVWIISTYFNHNDTTCSSHLSPPWSAAWARAILTAKTSPRWPSSGHSRLSQLYQASTARSSAFAATATGFLC